MQLIVHDHAEADLERLFETKEEAVGYIDSVIALIDDTPALFDKLFSEKKLPRLRPAHRAFGYGMQTGGCIVAGGYTRDAATAR